MILKNEDGDEVSLYDQFGGDEKMATVVDMWMC